VRNDGSAGVPPTQKRLVRDAFAGKNAKAALGKPKSNRSDALIFCQAC
jgi:hypothetical protein